MVDKAGNLASLVIWGGLALGFVFGVIASRANFCTMGAISDVVNMGHWGRMRMWLLAIAVAILGTAALSASGLVDLTKTIYQRPSLPLLSLVLGGALFGVGMTLAGGCVNKNLLRLGGGSLRSLVVLVFVAISAYMTLKGLFGQWRSTLLDPVTFDLASRGMSDQSLPTLLSRVSGLAGGPAVVASAGVLAAVLLAFVLKDRRFRGNMVQLSAGVVLGTLIVAAWYLTGHLGFGENPETLENVYFGTNTRTLESLSFVAPTAFSLELLLLWTDKSLHPSFGIASAAGVVLGSASHALLGRTFQWEGFASLEDLGNQLVGGLLMGFGGVTALGCTVGQGLSGVSTMAIGSFIALAAIIVGAVVTLKYMLWRAG